MSGSAVEEVKQADEYGEGERDNDQAAEDEATSLSADVP